MANNISTGVDYSAVEKSIEMLKNKEGKVYFYIPSDKFFGRGNAMYLYNIAGAIADMGYKVFVLQDEQDKGAPPKSIWMANFPKNVIHMPFSKATITHLDTLFIPELYITSLRNDFEKNNIHNIYCEVIAVVYDRFKMWRGINIGENWAAYNKKNAPFRIKKVIVPSLAMKEYVETQYSFSVGLEISVIPPAVSPVFHSQNKYEKPYVYVLCKDVDYADEFCKSFMYKYPNLSFFSFILKKEDLQEEYADTIRECAAAVHLNPKSTIGISTLEIMASGVPIIGKIPDFMPDFIIENVDGKWDIRRNADWLNNSLTLDSKLANYLQDWLVGMKPNGYEEMIADGIETAKMYNQEIQKNAITVFFKGVMDTKIQMRESLLKIRETKNND